MKRKIIGGLFLWVSVNITSNVWALDSSEKPEMVIIPAGSFSMGGNEFYWEKPIHTVNIKQFEIGKYEVTQGQWKAVMGSNPSHFNSCGDNCPVEKVSWDDIQIYLQKLNQKTGSNYRLLSEAEWEYACRGGKQQEYCGSDDVDAVAWYDQNSGDKTHPIGEKRPNGFGLYDMSGNVWEWVQDGYHDSYKGAPSDGSAWISGGSNVEHVLRGGSWFNGSYLARAAFRGSYLTALRLDDNGFRVARTIP